MKLNNLSLSLSILSASLLCLHFPLFNLCLDSTSSTCCAASTVELAPDHFGFWALLTLGSPALEVTKFTEVAKFGVNSLSLVAMFSATTTHRTSFLY